MATERGVAALPDDGLAVSVALCTFNGGRYIADQIASIARQTLPPAEIVLSDDGSSDDTVERARNALAECSVARPGSAIGLTVLQNVTPLRVTRNFEQAARACRSPLISLCDQDDLWHPERLRRMVARFVAAPELQLLHTNARLVDAHGRPLGETLFEALGVQASELARIHEGQAVDVLLRRNLVTGATTVFRRELLDRYAAPFPPEWVHDEWLGFIAAATGQVDVLEDALIDYRQHDRNQIGARSPSFVANVRRAFSSRGDGYRQRAQKAVLLLERLEALGDAVATDTIVKLRGKVSHQRLRAGLPDARWRRVVPVLREAMTGRYDQFGRARQAVIRDLFESP